MSKTAFLEKYGAKKDKKAKKEKKEKKSKKSKTNTGPAKDLAKYESTFHDTDDTFFQPRANEGATNEEDEGDDNDTPWSSMMNINNEDDGPIVVDKSGKVINVPSAAPITTAPVTAAPVAVLSKPARKRIGSDASDDSSPPRRRARADSDASVPRRSRADSSASESSSPPRRRARADSDASAPRRPSASETSSDESDEPPRKKRLTQMASGHSAGLQSGSQFQKKENEIKKEAEVEFSDMMKEGAGQQSTVYRDKSGKKLELSEHLKKQKEVEKQAKLAEEKELKEYRKGAKQKEEEKRRREEMQHLQSEGLARHAGDSRLEMELKSEMRMDDPMAKYMSKKKDTEDKLSGIAREKVYRGPPGPPNRYGIKPGYRWDGVDRGNGFEAKVLAKHAGRGLQAEKSYRWSSSDM